MKNYFLFVVLGLFITACNDRVPTTILKKDGVEVRTLSQQALNSLGVSSDDFVAAFTSKGTVLYQPEGRKIELSNNPESKEILQKLLPQLVSQEEFPNGIAHAVVILTTPPKSPSCHKMVRDNGTEAWTPNPDCPHP
jgi:hypothetical protein